ncbi:MAG TPA: ABC transporter substrate-binding protein, partial [Candidatus Dormibacteraeota bacterium]
MLRRLAALGSILLLSAACAQSGDSHAIVLGAIYPLSGPQAAGGKAELGGVQAALRVSGADVRLQVIDATTPEAAAAAVDTLVKSYHVPAILGTYGSTLSA